MAPVTPPRRGIVQRIIHSAAERLAQQPDVPPDRREAFRLTAVSIIEQQIASLLGYDTVRLSGWTMEPSERAARRQRIVDAIARGDDTASIAARERVSRQWVRRVRADIARGTAATPRETLPP